MDIRVAGTQQQAGFTLIELMLVVAIVAILAAIALPAYQGSVLKAHRATAQSYLLDAAQMQHQYYSDARLFAASSEQLNKVPPAPLVGIYNIAVVADPNELPPTFTITATPRAGTRQFDDGVLSIDNTGRKLRVLGGREFAW